MSSTSNTKAPKSRSSPSTSTSDSTSECPGPQAFEQRFVVHLRHGHIHAMGAKVAIQNGFTAGPWESIVSLMAVNTLSFPSRQRLLVLFALPVQFVFETMPHHNHVSILRLKFPTLGDQCLDDLRRCPFCARRSGAFVEQSSHSKRAKTSSCASQRLHRRTHPCLVPPERKSPCPIGPRMPLAKVNDASSRTAQLPRIPMIG